MSFISRIWFPAAVVTMAAAGALGLGSPTVVSSEFELPVASQDTVRYPRGGYKLHRNGALEEIKLADSLLRDAGDTLGLEDALDTVKRLTARDTIPVPDSLRLTDPFRYKYYVALIDSLTHTIVRDSLKHSYDSLRAKYIEKLNDGEVEMALGDSLHARLDSIDWKKIDSIYLADSAAIAKAEFLKWYNSLDRKARKKYDIEQMIPIRMHEMDSLKKAKEKEQEVKDSIVEYTPRILETYALPDSLQYKRIISWNVDQDFHKLDASVPDTSYNAHYYDYPFQRKDVNASWLGVAGSPVQYYNWFKRTSSEGVEFYKALESWSFSPSTMPQYNTKTPYTELAYYGTIVQGGEKESDNIHLLTTQNITPALNLTFMFDRYGGGGILENEKSINKTAAANLNYLGKKYMAHGGYIYNMVSHGENGGVNDIFWIRDTTVESREIDVNLKNASTLLKKNTVYLDQQYRIPFTFLEKWKAKKDSTYKFNPDSLDKDLSSAFIGHSSEFSTYSRNYTDELSSTNAIGSEYYNGVFNYGKSASADSMGVTKFDNKVFIRLQPFGSEAIVTKLDVGVGDCYRQYWAQAMDTTALVGSKHRENDIYAYAGAEGRYRNIAWDAKGRYVVAGANFSDLNVEANAGYSFYPFRRARKSPVTLGASFSTSLQNPDWYQRNFFSNHYSWSHDDFSKISTTKIEGRIAIPRYRFDASVGYALLANNIYYDTLGVSRQNTTPMSVLSASVRKDFVLGFLHLDNKALFQVSSNQDVLPLPTAALNLRYYGQFVLQRDASKEHNVLEMQIGFNAFYNTRWYAPAYNPELGVFHNQNERLYENGPYIDLFANFQWKRACIFVKWQNFGKGWPMEHKDYFSADRYIVTQDGMEGLKIGIFWPFYTQTTKNAAVGK